MDAPPKQVDQSQKIGDVRVEGGSNLVINQYRADARQEIALDKLRAYSDSALRDASLVAEVPQVGAVSLEKLYIEREVEQAVIHHLVASNSAAPRALIIGEAGCGKTSLLWRMHRYFGSPQIDWEPLFVKAAVARQLGLDELLLAVEALVRIGRRPVLLLDTVDLLLHDSADRDLLATLRECVRERDCALIATCRPNEAKLLPQEDPTFLIGAYSEAEMVNAISSHVSGFYARADRITQDEHKQQILEAVTSGRPVREVCLRPLTLRMLFTIYAPHEVPPEVNVFKLYDQFWENRVAKDLRAGDPIPNKDAKDLSVAAGLLALNMLAAGALELDVRPTVQLLKMHKRSPEELELLVSRGILRRSEEDAVEFFHQTFFEHAAARGMLEIFLEKGLDLLCERVRTRPDDLFVHPILEQAVILSTNFPFPFPKRGNEVLLSLLRSEDILEQSSGVYISVLMDASRMSDAGKQELHRVLRSTVASERLISSMPSVSQANIQELMKYLDSIWKYENWSNREHILDELPRIAGRGGRDALLVRQFLDRHQILKLVSGQPITFPGPRKLLAVLSALAPFDTNCWNELVSLFKYASTHGGNLQDRILDELRRSHHCFARPRIATDFWNAVMTGAESQGSGGVNCKDAWGRLLLVEWEKTGRRVQEVLKSPSTDPAFYIVELHALASLILRADEADVQAAWEHWLRLPASQRPMWPAFVWTQVLADPTSHDATGSSSAGKLWIIDQVIGIIKERPGGARQPEQAPLRGNFVKLVLDRPLGSLIHKKLLAQSDLEDPKRWSDLDDLGRLLVVGYSSGHPSARAVIDDMSTRPQVYERNFLTKTVSRMADYCSKHDLQSLHALLPLAIAAEACGPLAGLIDKQVEGLKPFLSVHIPALQALVEGAASSARGTIRRDGYRLWGGLLSLGLFPCPSFKDIHGRLEKESDRLARSQLAVLLGYAAAEASGDSARACAILSQMSESSDGNLRGQAIDALVYGAGVAVDYKPWATAALTAAIKAPSNGGYINRVGWLIPKLSERDIDYATNYVETLLTAEETNLLNSGTRNLRNTLRKPMRAWIAAASSTQRLNLFARIPALDPDIACLLLDAAWRQSYEQSREVMDALYRDTTLPEQVRSFIYWKKLSGERTVGGQQWPELSEKILAALSPR